MTSFIIFFLSGFLFAKYTIPPKEIVSERIVERKIQLPGETVKRTVTKDDIEAKGLKQAESKGIYDAAEKNLKVVINGFFSEFVDYEIIYM